MAVALVELDKGKRHNITIIIYFSNPTLKLTDTGNSKGATRLCTYKATIRQHLVSLNLNDGLMKAYLANRTSFPIIPATLIPVLRLTTSPTASTRCACRRSRYRRCSARYWR
jgi:hypothetical protein